MKSRVVLLHCPTYDLTTVQSTLQRGIDLLGGLSTLFRKGEKILLKPNLLYGQSPQRCVTTHPVVFEGIIRILQDYGVVLSFGDSPGYGKLSAVARKAGLHQIAEQYHVSLADFESAHWHEIELGSNTIRIPLSSGSLEADGIVSLPKMKTHGLTRITGAVKNQLGCVPGFHKAEFHVRFPNTESFASLLVKINLLLKPRLYIMDGIMAMEGEGPGSGDPVQMECLLLSQDPVALDATFCKLIDLDPLFVPTIPAGERLGLGTAQEDKIELLGDPLEKLKRSSFNVKRNPPVKDVTFRALHPFRNLVLPQPRIDPERCKRCGICVEACPVPGKALAFANRKTNHPVYVYKRCIRCFCCHEMCPHKAIYIYTPWLGRQVIQFLGGGHTLSEKGRISPESESANVSASGR
ncbi:MAG: DUF362 domain-containing protein [Spirochaetes bacterium]|nr:DUF362 domain-containing protein [Spirochaetota bacterium]